MGNCCLNHLQRIFTFLGSLWLIIDLVSDIVNTKQYHDKAFQLNGNKSFFNPSAFLYDESGQMLKESWLFYASGGALTLPIPAGIILILIFFIYDHSASLTKCTTTCCPNKCCGKCCGVSLSIFLLPCNFTIAITFSFLIVPIAWIFSPFLHISRALFALYGAKPAGDSGPIKDSKTFRRFWTFVLLLAMMEQILEALPQTIIGGVYFYLDQESHLWEKTVDELFPLLYEDHKTQIISLIFSAGSLLLFMITTTFQYTFDRPNSFFGLIQNLREQSHTPHLDANQTESGYVELP